MNLHYKPNIPITTWAEEDRPREKLLLHGRRALSDAELIAILIGTGNRNESAVDLSKRILHNFQNDLGVLARLSVQELSKFKGIGEAKAITIMAALELGRRRKETENGRVTKITCSKDAYELLRPVFEDLTHEEFWMLILNKANKVVGKNLVSKGGWASTVCDPKVVFKTALEYNAAGVIVAHNHPSGNLTPSDADIGLTGRLVSGGRLLDLPIFDHLIFGDGCYYSFADEGKMPGMR
ncbi:RadC family protein [Pseudopedobacter beijingensis]|uniref:DNA repair protein RadC n=1 Tax=Pseudopedobacter beijingensis TaxID=1207056 RepID=A0ABW4IEQ7_9SPHI